MNAEEYKQLEEELMSGKVPSWTPTAMQLLKEGFKTASISMNSDPFLQFFEDVITVSIAYNFRGILSNSEYDTAQDIAKTCIKIAPIFKNISQRTVIAWLLEALHFPDCLLIYYIEAELGGLEDTERIERARYQKLIDLNNDFSDPANELDLLYKLRNKEACHRTRILENGKQMLIKPNRLKILKEVRIRFPAILTNLLSSYKKQYPEHISS